MQEGLEYLHSLSVWKGGGGFGLDAIRTLSQKLGNPQDKPKLIHVAGTNGKGSTSVAIAAGLSMAGYSVGLNISPHLSSFNERISINGQIISNDELNLHAIKLKQTALLSGAVPTFHEAITILAFLAFENLDYAVLEVGLGGRLDASNVIRPPEVAVITSIGYDHQDILGDTLEEIAAEKAGIIKSNSTIITGMLSNSVSEVVSSKANQVGAGQVKQLGRGFKCSFVSNNLGYYDSRNDSFELFLPLLGKHQLNNFGVATCVLLELGVTSENINKAYKALKWPGRLEKITLDNDREVIIDCCHNVDGVETLISFLDSENITSIDLVFGALTTKNWRNMLNLLIKYTNIAYLLTPRSSMSVASKEVADYLSSSEISCLDYDDNYSELVDFLTSASQFSDRPLILAGSIYMVGELRKLIKGEVKTFW